MIRICAGIVTYGDWEGLARTMYSLWGAVDCIAVIHCQFLNNPHAIAESEEMTDKVMANFTNNTMNRTVVNYQKQRYWTEFQCRNHILKMANQMGCNYLLIIDSDEYIKSGNWTKFRENLKEVVEEEYKGEYNVFGVWATRGFNGDESDLCYYPRIWYKPHEMMYKGGSHYHFINKKEFNHYRDQYWTPAEKVIDGILMVHNHDLRIGQMHLSRAKYHEWLQSNEARIGREVLNKPIGHGWLDGSENPSDFPISPSELDFLAMKYWPDRPKVSWFLGSLLADAKSSIATGGTNE